MKKRWLAGLMTQQYKKLPVTMKMWMQFNVMPRTQNIFNHWVRFVGIMLPIPITLLAHRFIPSTVLLSTTTSECSTQFPQQLQALDVVIVVHYQSINQSITDSPVFNVKNKSGWKGAWLPTIDDETWWSLLLSGDWGREAVAVGEHWACSSTGFSDWSISQRVHYWVEHQ